jgi:hypothetical protein
MDYGDEKCTLGGKFAKARMDEYTKFTSIAASRANTISTYPTQTQCMNELVDDLDMSVFPGFLRSWFHIHEPNTFIFGSQILYELADLLNQKNPNGTLTVSPEATLSMQYTVCVCVPRCDVCVVFYKECIYKECIWMGRFECDASTHVL